MRVQSIALLLLLSMLALAKPAHAARSYDNCTGFITSVPTVISTPGTWCLKQDVTTAITSGDAITIAASNVVLDCNNFRLDGNGAGLGTATVGIYANNQAGDTVRNCHIRGFYRGMYFQGTGGRHLIEHNHFDQNPYNDIRIEGGNTTVRYNEILDTGGTTTSSVDAYGIVADGGNDLIGNTISGLAATKGKSGYAYAFSIAPAAAEGGSIIGNRVRGLVPDGGGAFGIILGPPQRMAIRDNDIAGDGSPGHGQGINCFPGDTRSHQVRVRNNVVSAFFYNIGTECGNAGENDAP